VDDCFFGGVAGYPKFKHDRMVVREYRPAIWYRNDWDNPTAEAQNGI